MKADLNKILAALQQLEQNPSSKSQPPIASARDNIADNTISEATHETVTPSTSAPIPPLQPSHQSPSLPIFDFSSQENVSQAPPTAFVAATLPLELMEELQQIVQQIENLYREGPIVDGWLESYPCESTSNNDETVVDGIVSPVEYVKAGSLGQDKVVCEAPRSCYRLNGISPAGQAWSHPCPIDQLPSVSLAIARYEKLLQLVNRKWDLEAHLK